MKMLKKLSFVVCFMIAAVLVTGCGASKNVEGTLEEIMTKVYADIPEEYFYGLRLAEQPKEINRGNDDSHASSLKEHIMNVYVSNQRV